MDTWLVPTSLRCGHWRPWEGRGLVESQVALEIRCLLAGPTTRPYVLQGLSFARTPYFRGHCNSRFIYLFFFFANLALVVDFRCFFYSTFTFNKRNMHHFFEVGKANASFYRLWTLGDWISIPLLSLVTYSAPGHYNLSNGEIDYPTSFHVDVNICRSFK
jgi:hypothetical protein